MAAQWGTSLCVWVLPVCLLAPAPAGEPDHMANAVLGTGGLLCARVRGPAGWHSPCGKHGDEGFGAEGLIMCASPGGPGRLGVIMRVSLTLRRKLHCASSAQTTPASRKGGWPRHKHGVTSTSIPPRLMFMCIHRQTWGWVHPKPGGC